MTRVSWSSLTPLGRRLWASHTSHAVVLLGLLTGAMLLIGAVFVPYWSALPPREFSRMFAGLSPWIGMLMLPLGVGATVETLIAAAVARARRSPVWPALALASACALFVAALYPLYFIDANAALASSTWPEEISAELERWCSWHWARLLAGGVAFVAAVRGLALVEREPAARVASSAPLR